MHGIISLLDQEHHHKVQTIWHELETTCGLGGIKTAPQPHFSWQVAENYDLDRVRDILEEISCYTRPFVVHTNGLGIFTGETPVLYIPIVKDTHLCQFHNKLWEQMQKLSQGMSPYYSPQDWVPHITLAVGDVTHFNLGCALEKMAFQTYSWDITINNLILAYQPEGQENWEMHRYDFRD